MGRHGHFIGNVAAAAPPRLSTRVGLRTSPESRRAPWLVFSGVFAALMFLQRASALPSEVRGRQLLVKGVPVHLKGVCWNPVRKGGTHPKDLDFRGFVASDAELMSRAGINVIRTYEAITDSEVLDVLWSKRIFVFNTVYDWGGEPIKVVAERVNAVKNHPAILAWVVGNEWNYNGLYVNLPFPQALNRVRAVVDLIKQNDGTHPVATVHGETPSAETLTQLSNVDIWGINRYSGISFGKLFEQWAKLSDLPFFLGEYGADAYDARRGVVDEEDQASAVEALTTQIVKASSVHKPGVCVGGFLFELADEWWKDGSGDPQAHDIGGVSPGGGPFPDFTFNEEWWGIVRMDGRLRKAFWRYASVATPGVAALSADGEGNARIAGELEPLRTQVCGAHFGCRGKIGFCCPSREGVWDLCCDAKAKTQPTPRPEPSTTWRPADAVVQTAEPGNDCRSVYTEHAGIFTQGKFDVGKYTCAGVAECQFLNLTAAQAFCNTQPSCTTVLLQPFEDDCAGGLGCYTPRHGRGTTNELGAIWNHYGGRAWMRQQSLCTSPSDAPQYAFMGFFKAVEAQSACKDIGQLAMPKTSEKRQELLDFIEAAKDADKLSNEWPRNTVWIGGQYNPTLSKWVWRDGSHVREPAGWGPGQPSAARTNQMTEPWLCMDFHGDMHDAEPGFAFGVICELGTAPATEYVPPTPQVNKWPAEMVRYRSLTFAGMYLHEDAIRACGTGKRLVMPKTDADWEELAKAVEAAMADGRLSTSWPRNMVWLGGRWSTERDRWEWYDGTVAEGLRWKKGQPSAPSGQQAEEPLLCARVAGGSIATLDSPLRQRIRFGVLCEDGELARAERQLSAGTFLP